MSLHSLFNDPQARALLDARAQELARQATTTQTDSGAEMVLFELGAGRYSLPAPAVDSVQSLPPCTALPAAPAWLLGLVNVRGRLLCVLDLRPLLELPVAPPAANALLLVVRAAGVEVGLLADAVQGVQPLRGDLAPTFAAAAGRGLPWVIGVDQHLALVLDPTALLADARLVAADTKDQ